MKTCHDCPAKVSGKHRFCADCALRRKKESEIRSVENKAFRLAQDQGRNYPPLVNGYPPMSRGWFRLNLKAGHTAHSLAALTGLDLKSIRRELAYMPARTEV